jgi:phosphate transport system protein
MMDPREQARERRRRRMAEMGGPVGRGQQHQVRFREELARLEQQVMGGLELVVGQLDRAIEAINYQDVELAAIVAADDHRIDGRYVEVHQGVLSLLGRQALFLDDLRLAAALLHSIRCIERMGDQCANMAKLVPLSGYEAPKDQTILEWIERMGVVVRQEVLQARDAFHTRHVALARDLVRQDQEVNRLNRDIFARAVEIGDDPELREWGMFMVLVARCMERIGDNCVDIAEQTVFVVTGLYRQFSEADQERQYGFDESSQLYLEDDFGLDSGSEPQGGRGTGRAGGGGEDPDRDPEAGAEP